jgi:transcriptional regulator with XRE-family HTH domain
MSSIGERLKEERERLGLTLVAFAELSGSKKNTVIDWQKDASSPPLAKLSALEKIGLDIIYIITGNRQELPESIPADEQLLLDTYRSLPIAKRREMLASLLTGDTPKASKVKGGKGGVIQGNGNIQVGGITR